MIRGPVASARSGPSGADRGAVKRAPEAKPPLPTTPRLDRHRGPGREPTASDRSIRPRPEGFSRPSSLQHSGPRTVLDNTLEGCRLNRPLEKESNLRQSDYESDALTKLSYPCRGCGSRTLPPDPNPALSVSYTRNPNTRNGAVYRAAKPPARAETKAPTVVLASVFVTGCAPIAPATGCRKRHCRGEFAASFGGGISAT